MKVKPYSFFLDNSFVLINIIILSGFVFFYDTNLTEISLLLLGDDFEVGGFFFICFQIVESVERLIHLKRESISVFKKLMQGLRQGLVPSL